ncbi:cyclin-like protein [Syncephalastrum racemosum]|uniref:Cyclin-like protein n=1 Tax=Syncephalastrum racemosum TaxID=13706 RepID=A0A1X2HDN5_SYNRA|nr:cyclin-like protein [Syncephalastrum racemosum]
MSGSSPRSSAPSTPVPITSGIAFKRRYIPYFTRRQLATLASLRRSNRNTLSKEVMARMASCKFIQQVGKKLGFPQNTISTAQSLYHRFFLFYSIRDYPPQEISITCMLVASKIEETIKKLKDIIVAVHSVRYPDSKELDPENISEDRRRKIIGYEKLLLETLCFDFQLQHPYEYIIKFVKWIQAYQELDGKLLAQRAYIIAVDSYRTALSVEYPAHTIAAGCIYLASMMLTHEGAQCQISPGQHWDQVFCSRMEDIEDVCQQILDMYIYQHSDDNELYTKFKIELNAQAERRGPDPNTDPMTESETGIRPSDWEVNGTSTSLEVINSNQHTVCYDFSCDAA